MAEWGVVMSQQQLRDEMARRRSALEDKLLGAGMLAVVVSVILIFVVQGGL